MTVDHQQSKCFIKYIDAQGYYDLGVVIFLVILAGILIWKTVQNSTSLRKKIIEGIDQQTRDSLKRRLWVNRVQLVFLFVFGLGMLWEIIVFIILRVKGGQFVKNYQFHRVYKVFEITFIHLLNVLNLTVGLLYWKSTNSYYTILDDEQIPLLFRDGAGKLFYLFYALNLIPFVLTIQCLFWTDIMIVVDISTLVIVTLSIIVCLGSKEYYRRCILPKLDTQENVINKQKKCSILLFISFLIRFADYLLIILPYDYHSHVREDNYPYCLDQLPYSALILLVLAVLVDLVPAFIYAHLFRGQREAGTIYQQLLS